jgi:hypothetical protein
LSNEEGQASREIDLPNGGMSIIMGNLIQQGPNSQNSNIVGYGMEGMSDSTDNHLYVLYNTILNEKQAGSFVQVNSATQVVRLTNNILAGRGSVLVGTPQTMDTTYNLHVTDTILARLVNSQSVNYRLTRSSPALGMANKTINYIPNSYDKLFEDFIPLIPNDEYVHQCSSQRRYLHSDVGAYENGVIIGVRDEDDNSQLKLFPNPASRTFGIEGDCRDVKLTDLLGNVVREYFSEREHQFDVSNLTNGLYMVRTEKGNAVLVLIN